MNSEKVKEIKKGLGCCSVSCTDCPYDEGETTNPICINNLTKNALTLINKLERENERLLEQRNKTYNIWVKDTEKLKDRIAELEGEITKLDIINSKLEMDIELLNKQNIDLEIDRDYYQEQFNEQEDFYVEWNKQQLKQFAERLKGKFDEQKHFYEYASISNRDISLTALNTAYRCLDETLKEFIDAKNSEH